MIWQTAPLVDSTYDEKEYEPLLSVLPNHTSAVNIVRWSPDGKFLASAGDDKAVIMWEYRSGPATAVAIASNDTFIPSENWQPKAVMRDGHKGDILDLCWSPDGKYIATASVDNSVAIWDVSTQRTRPRLVFGHESR
jgi:WD40 repeat protein